MCFCPLNLPQCTSAGHQPIQSGVFSVAGHDQTINSSSHNPVAWITALAVHTWPCALGEGVSYGKQWCLRPFRKVCIILCAISSPHEVGLFTSLACSALWPLPPMGRLSEHHMDCGSMPCFLLYPCTRGHLKLANVWSEIMSIAGYTSSSSVSIIFCGYASHFFFFPRVSDATLLAWEPQENISKCQTS